MTSNSSNNKNSLKIQKTNALKIMCVSCQRVQYSLLSVLLKVDLDSTQCKATLSKIFYKCIIVSILHYYSVVVKLYSSWVNYYSFITLNSVLTVLVTRPILGTHFC